MQIFILDGIENIVGKEKKSGYKQHFILFPQCLQMLFLPGLLKFWSVLKGLEYNNRFYYIPSSEILEFPIAIYFDLITSDDINFHFLL